MDELDVSASSIDELPDLWDGFARLVRAGLGIRSFGAQIMNLPPNYRTRSHDETETGQEEVYIGMAGAGWLVLDLEPEQLLPLDPEHMVRVGPDVPRTLASGPEGLRVLCLGGVPGQAYEPPEWTEPGADAPD